MLRRALYSSKSLARQNNHQVVFSWNTGTNGKHNLYTLMVVILSFHIGVSRSSFVHIVFLFQLFFSPQLGLPSTTIPIGSMGLVYLPTFTIKNQLNVGKYTIHGSYGVRLPPFSPIVIIGKGSEMLVGAICINSINVVMQRFHRDLPKSVVTFFGAQKIQNTKVARNYQGHL